MRSLLIVALSLVAGCNHKSAATGEWCQTYVSDLRRHVNDEVSSMTRDEANRRLGAERLRAMVGSDPAIDVAFKVCSDAADDSPARNEARRLRVHDLQKQVADYVAVHDGKATLDAAQAKQLEQLFEQLASAYSGPAPQ